MKLHWPLLSIALLPACTTPIGEIGLMTYQSDADYQFTAPLQQTTDCLFAQFNKSATKWQSSIQSYTFINEVTVDQKYPLRAGLTIRLESIKGKTTGILRIHKDADKAALIALSSEAVNVCEGEVSAGTVHRT
jgi:hypothetical protein